MAQNNFNEEDRLGTISEAEGDDSAVLRRCSLWLRGQGGIYKRGATYFTDCLS